MSTLIERESPRSRANGVHPDAKKAGEPGLPLDVGAGSATPEAPVAEPTRPEVEVPGTPQGRNGKGRMKPLLMAAGLAALLLGGAKGAQSWHYSATHVGTDDAYVTTDVVQITPQVSGKITEVLVDDNQPVKKGQLLALIDDSTFKADVDQASANLQVAEAAAQGAASSVGLTQQTGSAQIAQAQGGVTEAQSGIGAAQAEVARTQAGIVNAQAAVASSRANVTNAQAAVDAAVAGKHHAEQAVRAAEAQLANAEAGIATAQAGTQNAQAALEAAQAARNRAAQAVKSAQAGITAAQTGIKSAQAGVEAAQANAERASRDEERYAQLLKESAVSAQTADTARAAARTARAQLTSAQEAVRQAQSVLEQRQADLAAAQDAVAAADAQIRQAQAGVATAQQSVQQARAAAQQRQAELAASKDAVHTADAGIRQSRAQVAAQQQAVRSAEAAVQQARALWASSVKNVGQAQAKHSQAEGALEEARTAPRQVQVSEANYKTAQAKVAQAKAALENARIALSRTRIVAPVDGYVTRKTVQIGQQVAPGQSLMAVIPSNDLWVVANYKETQLARVRPGQKAEIEIDTFPGRKFEGVVDSLAPNTGAAVALLPPDNATGNFTKVVQRVPVKVRFTAGQQGLDLLRGGLSAVVNIQTRGGK